MDTLKIGLPYQGQHRYHGSRIRSEHRNLMHLAEAADYCVREGADIQVNWLWNGVVDEHSAEGLGLNMVENGKLFELTSITAPYKQLPDVVFGPGQYPESSGILTPFFENRSFVPVVYGVYGPWNTDIFKSIPMIVYLGDELRSQEVEAGRNCNLPAMVWEPSVQDLGTRYHTEYDLVLYLHSNHPTKFENGYTTLINSFLSIIKHYSTKGIKLAVISALRTDIDPLVWEVLDEIYRIPGIDIFTSLPYYTFRDIVASCKVFFDPVYYSGYYTPHEAVVGGDSIVLASGRLNSIFASSPYNTEKVIGPTSNGSMSAPWISLIDCALESKYEIEWEYVREQITDKYSIKESARNFSNIIDRLQSE